YALSRSQVAASLLVLHSYPTRRSSDLSPRLHSHVESGWRSADLRAEHRTETLKPPRSFTTWNRISTSFSFRTIGFRRSIMYGWEGRILRRVPFTISTALISTRGTI